MRGPALWALPLMALAGIAAALGLRRGRRKMSPAVIDAPPTTPPLPPELIEAPPSERAEAPIPARRRAWPLLIAEGLLLAGALLLPRPWSTVALALMIAVGLGARSGERLAGIGARRFEALRAHPAWVRLMRYRVPLGRSLMVAAAALLIGAVYFYVPERAEDRLGAGFALMLAGWPTLAAGISLLRGSVYAPAPVTPAQTPADSTRLAWWHVLAAIGGAGLLLLLAEWGGLALRPDDQLYDVATHVQFGVLVAGVALVVIGLGGARIPRGPVDGRMVYAVAGLLGVALFLRFWLLNDTIRFLVDELAFTTAIHNVQNSFRVRLLIPFSSQAAFPYIFPYWQSLSVLAFGRDFEGLRGASALIGALTIPAAWLVGRGLFDRATGLTAALLLASFPPHLHFSRLGLNNIADPLFGTLALGCLGMGIHSGRRVWYVAGGAMLGLTHYFYEGGRLLYTPLALAWLVALWLLWRGRVQVRNWAYAGLAALIVALPIYYVLIASESALFARFDNNSMGLGGDYWAAILEDDNLARHLEWRVKPALEFFISRVDATLFYRGETALVLALVAPMFLLGCGWALRHLRAPGPLLLALWIGGAALGNSLLIDSLQSPRYVVVFPALMLAAAVGLRYTLAAIFPNGSFEAVHALPLIALALFFYQGDYYFNRHIPQYNVEFRQREPSRDGQDAVLRSLHFPQGTHVHIIGLNPPPSNYVGGLRVFLTDAIQVDVLTPRQFTPQYLRGLNPQIDHAFYLEPDDAESLALIRRYFEVIGPQASPYDLRPDQQFMLYYSPYIAGFTRRDLDSIPLLDDTPAWP